MITLNMIVKNEARVMQRCLNSVLYFIDEIVIVDTGSTDDTKNIIKNFASTHNIPLKLLDKKFTNFGECRNYALSQITRGFAFWLDADEIMMGNKKKKEQLKTYLTQNINNISSANVLIKFGNIEYYRKQIVNTNNNFEWVGVLHEYINSECDFNCKQINDLHIFVTTDGNSHTDPDKYLKHAEILEIEYEKTKDPRWKFYQAQSYECYGDIKKAIECYEDRLKLFGFWEEVYISKLRLCRLYAKIGIIKFESDDSCRLELLYEKIKYYENIDLEYSYFLAKKGYEIYNTYTWQNCILFIEHYIYDKFLNMCDDIFKKYNNR
jgi:glycosyltransferase involved in cell wall biosynthesis